MKTTGMSGWKFTVLAIGMIFSIGFEGHAASEAMGGGGVVQRSRAEQQRGRWTRDQSGEVCKTAQGELAAARDVVHICGRRETYPAYVEQALADERDRQLQATNVDLLGTILDPAGLFRWTCSDAKYYVRGKDNLGLVDSNVDCAKRSQKCGYAEHEVFRVRDEDGNRKVRCIGIQAS